eukprot:6524150-Lingulodinium_polyedra.AAC.1
MEAVREAAAGLLRTGAEVTVAGLQGCIPGDPMNAEDIARCVENWTEIGQWVQGDGRLPAP